MDNGLFITLADEASLALYLQEGVLSQHQRTEMTDDIHHSSNHYKILADYACAREGTHVFFFRDRTIYYGGQVVSGTDDSTIGAFWINGKTSPMGRKADAGLGWDESERYGGSNGVFERSGRNEPREMAQSFLLKFDTEVNDAGAYIRSDDLYFELGDYPFPLKSNTIRGRGFCPMGPGETRRLLAQIEHSDQKYSPDDTVDIPDVTLDDSAIEPFRPAYGIDKVKRANLTSEAHLEAAVIANPSLLPDELAPSDHWSIVRQAPISPLKPMQIDHIDICYYDTEFEDGMYPTQVLELKYTEPDDPEQIRRYREATDKMADHHLKADPDDIAVGMFSPTYGDDFSSLDRDAIERIQFHQFEESPLIPPFAGKNGSN